MNKEKRKESALVPYRFEDGKLLVYLQKRSANAKRYPGFFGFWGGGFEGDENPEEAMLREIKEELDLVASGYSFFKQYNFKDNQKNFFMLKVAPDFEKKIKVQEGDYGKWFSKEEVEREEKINPIDRQILNDIFFIFKI